MLHQDKLGLSGNIAAIANNAINPKQRVVQHLRENWVKENIGGLDRQSIEERLMYYAETNPDITIKMHMEESSFCIVLITQFMKRVHQIREAGEVVFVDATSNCDSQNMAVVPMLCASPSGALPLAFMFLSNQTEEMFTQGT